jgi:protein-S-isoprenylcysteine O-methyltransferase Ste14
MENLDIFQRAVAYLYFTQITLVLVVSIWKRRRFTLGTMSVTAFPGAIVLYFLLTREFISTGNLVLQVAGFVLYVLSTIYGFMAFSHLGYTNSDDFWLARWEQKPRTLVTTGPYARVRHPVFVSLMLQYLGLSLVFLHPVVIVLWFLTLIFGAYTSIKEEKFMQSRFPEYALYRQRTGRFFPRFGGQT